MSARRRGIDHILSQATHSGNSTCPSSLIRRSSATALINASNRHTQSPLQILDRYYEKARSNDQIQDSHRLAASSSYYPAVPIDAIVLMPFPAPMEQGERSRIADVQLPANVRETGDSEHSQLPVCDPHHRLAMIVY
jgi:hypothetical protein